MPEPTTEKPPVGKVIATPICFPPDLLTEIDAHAEAEGLLRGRSTVVRRACTEYLERTKKQAARRAPRTQKQEQAA